ncbi:hypothetical protein [Amycolatopsis decaplanina]|uniref:Uncharacterized protein n=1 Tax=Amycolatopsis decaplanina DSM 44594 TaxID=1284240 RepID=M2ZV78_9PSEU|nr:hypothetical protein [Amycolatopsis decaplanina]EME64623.1 hypothetical protein H074_01767 [Amycolatopsis decaplanina DSM 44594]
MDWTLVERASWIAGIVSALLAVIAAWMAYRATKRTTRDLALLISAATDKPEVLERVEAAARERVETIRRRVRDVLAATATATAFLAASSLIALLLAAIPDHVPTTVAGGDVPRTVQECANAGEVSLCTPMHIYELAPGGKVETRFTGGHRPAERGTGALSVELPDCEAEVRWHVSVGGAVAAEAVSRDILVRVEFPVASDQEYTFTAERPADSGCPKTEVRVRTGITFDR